MAAVIVYLHTRMRGSLLLAAGVTNVRFWESPTFQPGPHHREAKPGRYVYVCPSCRGIHRLGTADHARRCPSCERATLELVALAHDEPAPTRGIDRSKGR